MKKTLLLSVVASTMIMAGGDIAPVEPMVVEPVVEASGWDFSGQAVVYYQTLENKDFMLNGDAGLFSQTSSLANAGIQLRAVNSDVFYGVGAGVEVSGLATLGLENDVVSNVMQNVAGDDLRGGWISQAYLTYGFGNTSIKAGRQELPKALSPFAFSEGWNVFKNTFDAALIVNTDISNTTLVGAWVESANMNGVGAGTDMGNFNKVNGGAGIFMLTAQNKSVENLTLTGSYYYAADFTDNNTILTTGTDAHILWGDATYGGFEGFTIAGQAGTVMSDDFATLGSDDVVAWGLKAGGNYDMFSLAAIYTSVDDGGVNAGNIRKGVFNVGGVKTPLYSQLILNQDFIRTDSDTFVAKAGLKALGGKFGAAYNYSAQFDGLINERDYSEFDLTYKTKVFNDSTTLFAGYIYQNLEYTNDRLEDNVEFDQNVLRFWGRYNF